MYQQYAKQYQKYLAGCAEWISGKSSAENFECDINPKAELNALKNSSSSEQLIHTSNAYYDQVAMSRSLKEIYKTPNDYLQQYVEYNAALVKSLDSTSKEVTNQIASIEATIDSSKTNNSFGNSPLKYVGTNA